MKNYISVILPVHNGAAFLSECLTSIINQSNKAFEIIVIDDGSTDDSKAVAEKFVEVSYFRIKNAGVAAARNFGIEKSSGNLIAFIDQDDFWYPDSLTDRLQFMEENPHADIVIGRQKWFLHGLTSLPSWVKQEQMNSDLDGYLLGCALIRRSLFSEFGLFDTSFRFCSDFNWFFNLKDNSVMFYPVEKIVLNKRIHDGNESRHAELSLKELTRAIFNSIKRKRTQTSMTL